MTTFYLTVAGYTIKLLFEPAENIFYRNRWIQDIQTHFKGFITQKNFVKPHYSLKFIETRSFPIEKKTQKGKKYINYFIDSKKNEGTTFYITSMAQFELILMDIVSKLFKKDSGFFFHASASFVNNNAYLFTGYSGAGKSTIAELLSTRYEPIGDDVVIMKKINNMYYIYQTTHHEKKDNVKKTNKEYKVDKIFILKKSTTNKIRRIINKDEITKILLSQIVFYFTRDVSSVKHLIKFISKFDSFYELSFTKDQKEVQKIIRNLK